MPHPDGPEVVVWTEGPYRCELWSVAGAGRLRVFEGTVLLHEEPFGIPRAEELRRLLKDGLFPPRGDQREPA